jgi:hypothetical protein
MFGRFLLNLFVWNADYPITRPFAKLFTSDAFDRRDIIVLGATGLLALIVFVAGLLSRNAAAHLVGRSYSSS